LIKVKSFFVNLFLYVLGFLTVFIILFFPLILQKTNEKQHKIHTITHFGSQHGSKKFTNINTISKLWVWVVSCSQ